MQTATNKTNKQRWQKPADTTAETLFQPPEQKLQSSGLSGEQKENQCNRDKFRCPSRGNDNKRLFYSTAAERLRSSCMLNAAFIHQRATTISGKPGPRGTNHKLTARPGNICRTIKDVISVLWQTAASSPKLEQVVTCFVARILQVRCSRCVLFFSPVVGGLLLQDSCADPGIFFIFTYKLKAT